MWSVVGLNHEQCAWCVLETTPSFGWQKHLALPKTPDQIKYYSRQFYLYNCTVVEGSSKSPVKKDNMFAYCWTEKEIASIVFHRLRNTDLTGIKTVRLIADGCLCQNKNTGIIAMCSKWLIELAPNHVRKMEIFFTVVGHSSWLVAVNWLHTCKPSRAESWINS